MKSKIEGVGESGNCNSRAARISAAKTPIISILVVVVTMERGILLFLYIGSYCTVLESEKERCWWIYEENGVDDEP